MNQLQGVPSSPPGGGIPSTPNNFRSSPPLLDDEDEIDNDGIPDLDDLDEEMDGVDLMENMERCIFPCPVSSYIGTIGHC